MSKLMLKSDIAISSGGSTLYELALTKTPALVLLQAENQVRVAEKVDDKSVINLGYEEKIINIADVITDLIKNKDNYINDFINRKKINFNI
jgi:spore coat polysaccharide biosynthesis predicted glycosyltransferase SpsG